jgi:hypothetical protein
MLFSASDGAQADDEPEVSTKTISIEVSQLDKSANTSGGTLALVLQRTAYIRMYWYTATNKARGAAESRSDIYETEIEAKVLGFYRDGFKYDDCWTGLLWGYTSGECQTVDVTDPAGSQFWVNDAWYRWETSGYGEAIQPGNMQEHH